jgi:hypothetical protein
MGVEHYFVENLSAYQYWTENVKGENDVDKAGLDGL